MPSARPDHPGHSSDRLDLAAMRENYMMGGLSESDLAGDWLTQFRTWLSDAVAAGVTEPNAMVLATANRAGVPAARTVLAKQVDADGVVFYTNYGSAKSDDLSENPWAAVTFPWYSLQRQIHVRGPVSRVDRETTAAYWITRPHNSQIGSLASPQSSVVPDRAALDALQEAAERRYPEEVVLPDAWGGWRIEPRTVEFWQGRSGRMHDRLRFRLDPAGWIVERLAP